MLRQMRVKSLKINNLRNVALADIVAHEQLNILYGDNGAGKTSVLEALVVLGKGRSFRTGQIASLIGPQQDSFLVAAQTKAGNDSHRLGLERSRNEWLARIDGRNVSHVSELAEFLPFTLMEPNSHLLVSGTPDTRRKFLDWGVFHVKHGFLDCWRHYALAVRQRNAALRSGDARVIESLEPQLVRYGGEIDLTRRQQVTELAEVIRSMGAAFMPAGMEVQLEYSPGWRGEDLASVLSESRSRDIERGSTLNGPHRAELQLTVDGMPARERLSRGEQKLLAAALLLGQAQILCGRQVPLLLLDDLASEFDRTRLEQVLAAGREMGAQVA
jgi:DNA replication and repair protein RecF